jgi:hypothetical protein
VIECGSWSLGGAFATYWKAVKDNGKKVEWKRNILAENGGADLLSILLLARVVYTNRSVTSTNLASSAESFKPALTSYPSG